jgi:hypothetical protein
MRQSPLPASTTFPKVDSWMSYVLGSGWWVIWYALLWLALVPFVVSAAALTRATPDEPMLLMENAFAISSLGLVVLMAGTVISSFLWTVTSPTRSAWIYIRNVGGGALAAVVIGLFFIFFAGYYAVTPKLPMMNRWAAQILSLGSAVLLLVFCLHATWRFRHRRSTV